MKRLECLDGLRGALAVYVMLGHMAPFAALPYSITQPLSHGGAAVDVFFVLSGLVIVRSLESFRHQPRPFLIARAARIFPVYLVMFALAMAVQRVPTDFERLRWIGLDSPARGIWSDGWPRAWLADVAAHLTMTHGMFPNGILPDVWVSFLGAAWSLSTEWQFYVLALVLSMAGMRARNMATMLLGVALAGLAWRQAVPDTWQFSRAFLPNKAQYFALGVASAVLVRGERPENKGTPLQAGHGGYLAHFITILICTLVLCELQGGIEKLLPPLIWTLCLAAQLRQDRPGTGLLASVLRARPMLWVGTLSYCIYLANEPTQKLLGFALGWLAQGDPVLFTFLWVPAAILLPIGIAAWLHRWIEVPAQRCGRTLALNQIVL
jgi:peptidoglycan/LPS O-acetylase OafA/YrhL